ncbi:hypothetical protein JCM17478_33470 [Thermopirellula anaerolimosa]
MELVWSRDTVPAGEKIEAEVRCDREYARPFDPECAALDVVLVDPAGATIRLPAFWMQPFERRTVGRDDWWHPVGKAGWYVRFSPQREGTYRARAVLRDDSGESVSAETAFRCEGSVGRGFLRIAKENPRFLAWDDGTPFFAVGQNLAFIGEGQYFNVSRTEGAFTKLAENGANFLRVWTCCEDWALCLEGRKSAWTRTWSWDPPVVDLPGETPPPPTPAGIVGPAPRKAVRWPGGRPLRPDRPHRVAVRPDGEYRLELVFLTSHPGRFRGKCLGREFSAEVPASAAGRWTTLSFPLRAGGDTWWLGPIELQWDVEGTVYLYRLELREAGGGPNLLPEAAPNLPVLGWYHPLDCAQLDHLVEAAKASGIVLQLCLLTRDLYMHRLKNPADPAYDAAVADAKRLLRYAVARWGYSRAVGVWEYWNEMDPGLPTDRFYQELGDYLKVTDPYGHLRATSTWGPSPKDCRHPALDIAQVHYYLRPTDRERIRDVTAAVVDRTAFLRQHAPEKPALIAEFGLADDRWGEDPEMRNDAELLHFRQSLWASAVSGTSGTVMFWWWDRLDRMNAYPHYLPVSRFAQRIPWSDPNLRPSAMTAPGQGVRVLGLQTDRAAYLWMVRDQASWLARQRHEPPPEAKPVVVSGLSLPPGRYLVRWWDTRTGEAIEETPWSPSADDSLTTPPFAEDLAAEILPADEKP